MTQVNEVMVLAAVKLLQPDAYGVTIGRALENATGRRVTPGHVYTVLGRLYDRNMITCVLSTPIPVRGGRSRRYYHLTPDGSDYLSRVQESMRRLYDVP